MEGFIELDTIAVIAITLAALTSLLAAVRGGNLYNWPPRLRLGFWILVHYSLGALVFALLPSLGRDFGATSWIGPVLLLSAFHVVSAVLFLRRHLRLVHAGIASRSRILWFVGAGLMFLTPLVLIGALVGGFGGPSYGLYHFGVSVCLLSALGAFVGFLRLDPPATEPREGE